MSIHIGDCLEVLKTLESNSVDSLVTDPPAGISFMGKDWDSDKGGRTEWIAWMSQVMRECIRVLKPGAHGLVWAIPRTSHWTATALEDAGFEVRDVITHLFGSGFPKSLNIEKAIEKGEFGDGRDWAGFGTALKPAAEFWILIRKPLSEKTVAKNVLKWGCGGLNIDGCRIEGAPRTTHKGGNKITQSQGMFTMGDPGFIPQTATGRFPANLVLSGDAPELLDEQSGTKQGSGKRKASGFRLGGNSAHTVGINGTKNAPDDYGDSGGASRFFYCAKVSPSERGEDNKHPTVKPLKLMRYLIRLITPPKGLVLDPFTGSGSTGVAAKQEGFGFLGIERESEYAEIAVKRMEATL